MCCANEPRSKLVIGLITKKSALFLFDVPVDVVLLVKHGVAEWAAPTRARSVFRFAAIDLAVGGCVERHFLHVGRDDHG